MSIHTRCKFYNDQGDLVDKKHKGYSCRFAHPDMPTWKTATRSRIYSETINQGRKHSRSDFATNAWTADKLATHTNAVDTSHGRKSWEHLNNKQNEDKKAAQSDVIESGSSWQDMVDNRGHMGGWNSYHLNNGWASQGSGWGSADVEMNEVNITESTTGSKAAEKEASPWGTEGTGWGNFEVGTGRDSSAAGFSKEAPKERGNEDVTPHTPLTSAQFTGMAGASHSVAETKKPDLARLDTNLQTHNTFASPLQSTTMLNVTPSTGDCLGARFYSIEDDPFSAPSPVSASFYQNYKGCNGRVSLFKDIILHMQEAVMYQMIHAHAQSEAARWKKAQASEIYSHPTNKARSILEAHTAQFGGNVSKARHSRDRALRRLIRLPDLGSNTYNLAEPATARETIIRYTTELKEWFEDLEIRKRLPKHTKDVVGPPQPNQSPADDLSALLSSDTWTWQDLKRALILLEESIDNSFELVYSEKYTHQDFLSDPLASLVERLIPAEASHILNTFKGDAEKSYYDADTVDGKISSGAVEAAELITQIDNLQREYMELEADRAKIDAFCDKAEQKFSQYDTRNQVDEANIAELTSQVQQLFLHKSSVQLVSHTATKPIPVEGYLDCLRPVIIEYMKHDLNQIFENLLARCRENQEQTSREVDRMIQPLITLTEQVRRTPQEADTAQIAR